MAGKRNMAQTSGNGAAFFWGKPGMDNGHTDGSLSLHHILNATTFTYIYYINGMPLFISYI